MSGLSGVGSNGRNRKKVHSNWHPLSFPAFERPQAAFGPVNRTAIMRLKCGSPLPPYFGKGVDGQETVRI